MYIKDIIRWSSNNFKIFYIYHLFGLLIVSDIEVVENFLPEDRLGEFLNLRVSSFWKGRVGK